MKLKKKDMCEDIVKITISSGTATNTTFEYEPESQLLKRWVFGNYDAPRGFAKHLRENAEVVTISREASEHLTEFIENIDFAWDGWEITEEVKYLMMRETCTSQSTLLHYFRKSRSSRTIPCGKIRISGLISCSKCLIASGRKQRFDLAMLI